MNLNIAYLFILITPLSPLEDFHNRFVLLPRRRVCIISAHVLRLFMFRLCKFSKLCSARVGLSSVCESFRMFPLLSILLFLLFLFQSWVSSKFWKFYNFLKEGKYITCKKKILSIKMKGNRIILDWFYKN